MGHSHTTKCPKCGTWLYIYDAPLLGAGIGCKFHDEVNCPKCGYTVYEANTSGQFEVTIVDKPEQI